MKVILLKDVPKLGRTGDVKDVAEGFALNLLLPQGKAERATPEKVAAIQKAKQNKDKDAHDKVAMQLAALKKIGQLTITSRATLEGGLFEGVTAHKLAISLRENGLALPEDAFALKAPIKKTGEYAVTVQVGGLSHVLKVHVKAQ